MARESSRKKGGYAAWLLTKMFDELTGNYFGDATTENRGKTFISESEPDGHESNIERNSAEKALRTRQDGKAAPTKANEGRIHERHSKG